MPVISVNKEVYEYLRKLKEEFGLNYSDIIMILIKLLNSNEIPSLLEQQNKLLEKQNKLLEDMCNLLKELKSLMLSKTVLERTQQTQQESVEISKEVYLPSFVRNNPWLEVLAKRGIE